MEIDIKEYLSEGEIKEIVQSVVREEISNKISRIGLDSMISNFAYDTVMSVVSNEAAEQFKEQLTEKLNECVDSNMSFYAFYDGKHLDKLMKETIQNNRQKLVYHMLKTFMSRNYDDTVLQAIEHSAEQMMGNVYDIVKGLSSSVPK